MNPPRAGSIPVVRPSINGPFVTETQDKPFPTRNHFFCKKESIHLAAFKRIQAIGIRLLKHRNHRFASIVLAALTKIDSIVGYVTFVGQTAYLLLTLSEKKVGFGGSLISKPTDL